MAKAPDEVEFLPVYGTSGNDVDAAALSMKIFNGSIVTASEDLIG